MAYTFNEDGTSTKSINDRQNKKRTDAAVKEASYRERVNAYTKAESSRPAGNYPRDTFGSQEEYREWLKNF
jgi:hypothetical protein